MERFLKACHDAVIDGEAKTLAGKMGLPHVSLLQRANPDNDAHRLTINQLFQILLHTGDMRPLEALADLFGYQLVAKDKPQPKALVAALIGAGKEFADLTLAIHEALADSHVNQIEKATISREVQHLRESLDVIDSSVKAA